MQKRTTNTKKGPRQKHGYHANFHDNPKYLKQNHLKDKRAVRLAQKAAKRASRAALCLVLAMGLLPIYAFAESASEETNTEGARERGLVYVGYNLGEGVKGEFTAASAPDGTLETYSVRIGYGAKQALSIEDILVKCDGKNITQDCFYHAETGYLSIPTKYSTSEVHTEVQVTEDLSSFAMKPNVYISLGGADTREATSSVVVKDGTPSIHIAVSGNIAGISQDTGILNSNEWYQTSNEVILPARCALSGSVVIHMQDDTHKGIAPMNLVEAALTSAEENSTDANSGVGIQKAYALGGFTGSGTLISTNPGPTNDDYTNYILTWEGNSASLNCCEHGIIHIPNVATGVTANFTASVMSSSERTWDEITPTEIIHYTETTETYNIYVDGDQFGTYTIQNGNSTTQHGYQSVQGAWTGQPEVSEWREPRYGKLDVQKYSSNTSITNGNGCYSLNGARYGVYTNPSCTSLQTTITTNSNGYALSGDLRVNRYYVKEISAPKGYALDSKIYPIDVVADTTMHVNSGSVSDTPQSNPASIWVSKLDLETGGNKPQGGGSLAGAEFKIRYFAGYYSSAADAERSNTLKRTWIVRSNDKGQVPLDDAWKVSGDAFYRNSAGKVTIPLGTVLIQETKAPAGYLLSDSNVYVRQITSQGTAESVNTFNAPSVKDQIKRGDLEFVKARETDQARLGKVPFRITSTSTNESHILVTDANGQASTANSRNAHSTKTNTNDAAVSASGDVDESKLDPSAGIWFGKSAVNNSKGAIPFDTYKLEELRCSSNKGTELVSLTVVISQDTYTVDFGTIDNQPQAAITITTDASNKRDGSKQAIADPETQITDRVEYKNVQAGKTYTLVATVMDRETKQPLIDASGNPITAKKDFTPSSVNGTEDVTITLDSTSVAGRDIVIFEKLLNNANGDVLAVHEDIDDYSQTIKVLKPSIKTYASDLLGNGKSVATDPEAQFKDTVSFNNLIAGMEYTLTGTLMLKDGSVPYTDASGKPYTATTTFTPEDENGTVEVVFECNSVDIAGKQIVVYEELQRLGKTIAEHKDAADTEQTIDIKPVSIWTTAKDALDGNKNVSAAPEENIVDTLHYENVIPGKEYIAKGSLHIRTVESDTDGNESFTDAPLKDNEGAEITSELRFTPQNTSGEVDIVFPIDATQLANKDIVVFEELYRNETLIASHTDISDESQTVHITPIEISTKALNAKDNSNIIPAEDASEIADTVRFSGLTPGKEYALEGTLMVRCADPNSAGGILVSQALDSKGNPITARETFIPDDQKGTASIIFNIDATLLAGKDIVVFEKLYLGDTQIAQHESPTDAAQTLSVKTISISTTLYEKDTEEKSLAADSEAKLIDEIRFKNALVGKEYDIFGMLLDSNSGLPIIQSQNGSRNETALNDFMNDIKLAIGIKQDNNEVTYPLQPNMDEVKNVLDQHKDIAANIVTCKETFTPDTGSGTHNIMYKFDARGLEGTSATSCMMIADHSSGTVLTGETDLANESQTVNIMGCRIKTFATDSTDSNKELLNSANARINDQVAYTGLTAGKQYTIRGILYDKQTEEPLLINDEKVTATKDFVPAASDGTLDVEFKFDATGLDGHEVVVFEELFRDMETSDNFAENVLIAGDGDINNTDQTVSISGSAKPSKALDVQGLAKTGDQNQRYLKALLVLGVIAMGALAIGTALSKRRKKTRQNDTLTK